MKNMFLKIASAAAATSLALTFCVSGAVADNANTTAVPAAEAIEVNDQMIADTNAYSDAFNKAFEEALADEISKFDIETVNAYEEDCWQRGVIHDDFYTTARDSAKKKAEEKCAQLGLYNDAVIGLTLVSSTPFNSWKGNYYVYSVEETRLSFRDPDSFNFSVGNTNAKMTAKSGYEGNFKECKVTLYYKNGAVSTNTETSNNSTFSVRAESKGPTIRSAVYDFKIYKGTGSAAGLLEEVRVTLNLMEPL